jgi:hypothetical protein
MKRFAAAILGALALAACSVAAQPQSNRAEVQAAAHEFDQAQLHKDRATLERFLAPEYRIVRSSGRIGDRADFIATFTSAQLTITAIEVANPYYADLGRDAAIIGGEGTIRGTENGAAFVEHFMYSDIFEKRNGQWVVVYTQITPLPPAT